MTGFSMSHGTFTLQRRFAAPVARVFRAWSVADELKLWAAPAEGWTFAIDDFDFRVGGGAVMRFGPPGAVPYQDVTRYDDIVADCRIVTAYAVTQGPLRISSSVSCLEFTADAGGTHLRITELGVYLDGHDSVDIRKAGVAQQMQQLDRFTQRP